jgi:hypothetical protein
MRKAKSGKFHRTDYFPVFSSILPNTAPYEKIHPPCRWWVDIPAIYSGLKKGWIIFLTGKLYLQKLKPAA